MPRTTFLRAAFSVFVITITLFTNVFSFIYLASPAKAQVATTDLSSNLQSDPDPSETPEPTPEGSPGEDPVLPTEEPADPPAETPTEPAPTEAPTEIPTEVPPTEIPTEQPPTETPTEELSTEVPTEVPTEQPPTETPTEEFSTEVPTETPTEELSTEVPTETPTEELSTEVPTETPTEEPSATPTPELKTMGASSGCQMDITDAADADPLTYRFMAAGSADITAYLWDFGDSNTSPATDYTHTYEAHGDYTIRLTCTPEEGTDIVLTTSLDTTSTAISPIASFTLSDDVGEGSLTFATTNTSTGSNPLTYAWVVSGPEADQTSSAFEPSFTVNTMGTYTVALTVTDTVTGLGSMAWRTVEVVDYPPNATFTLSPTLGVVPLTVTVEGFANPGSGTITSWTWNFGDGAVATDRGPHTHEYLAANIYTIRMDYTGTNGSGWIERTVYVDEPVGVVTSNFTYASNGNVPGGVEICFTNVSTGVITKNIWTFGDGSPSIENNNPVVCHTYAVTTDGYFNVTLYVEGVLPSISASATKEIYVVAGPVANFEASDFNITWGDGPIHFTDTSTGIITDWLWEFDYGNGGATSTEQNPDYEYADAGTYTVRLTVDGPGGSSYVEKIIFVAVLEITCDFNGTLTVYPGESATYTSTIGDLQGRDVSYSWRINGGEIATTADLTQLWSTAGTYLLELAASTLDGAACTQTRTVTVEWADLGCSLSGDFNPAPNSAPVTYTATVDNQQGRSILYEWFVNNVSQGAPSASNTFSTSWDPPDDGTTLNIRFNATGTPEGSCSDNHDVHVQWPDLSCSLSGELNPNPLPDSPVPQFTYTANVTPESLAGRTITAYRWWVNGVLQGETGPTLTLSWLWNQTGTYQVQFDVISSINSASCSTTTSLEANVAVPALTCGIPIGDSDPVIGDSVNYLPNVSNAFGRTISYAWELLDSTGSTVLESGTGNSFPRTFTALDAGNTYILRYTASVIDPVRQCTGQKPLTVANPGQGFTCGDQGNTWTAADFNPASPTADYTYGIYIDNYTGIPLTYTWTLVPDGWAGTTRTLLTQTSAADGVIEATFNGSVLGPPIGNYQLVVSVVDPADPTHAYDCDMTHVLIVGAINVDYSFTVDNDAVGVDEEICLTNTSTNSFGTIDDLTYVWDLGTADNSLGTQIYNGKEPPCFSYNTVNESGYSIRLTGSANGLSASAAYVFRVFGLQSITIVKSNHTVAPANMTFSANGVNIDSYMWYFYREGETTPFATRSGQNVAYYFNTAGRYIAEVRGQGHLGETRASVPFELIRSDEIRAAFTPSVYGGIAPLNVCFTDNSVGSTINLWEWDFDDNGTIDLSYDRAHIPASICYTYTMPGRVYVARLQVSNGTLTAPASNPIRTYNDLESRSSFSINPQGNGLYCFIPSIPAGTTITEWDFGDGTTSDTNGNVCHSFQGAGNYIISMRIERDGTTGEVIRTLIVTPDGVPIPALNVAASCSLDRTASFTITNTGDSMTVPDEVRVTRVDRYGTTLVFSDSFMLAHGASKTFTIPVMQGDITISALDNTLTGTLTTTCEYPPDITVSAACQGNQVAFVIHNADGPMIAPQSYEVRDSLNAVVASGSFQIARGGADVTVLVANPYGPYTFTSSGTVGTFSLTHECTPQPALIVTPNDCSTDEIAFTVTNTTANPMVVAQNYTITRGATTVASGSFTLGANGTQTFTVPAGGNPYSLYTFTSNGYASNLTATKDCPNPNLQVTTNTCSAGSVQFTIRNAGGSMLVAQSFTVTKDGVDVTATVTPGSPFTLAAGISQTFTVPTATIADLYARYVLTTNGFAGNRTLAHDCEPAITVTSVCSAAVAFTITNTSSGPMLEPQTVSVTSGGSPVPLSATTFQLAAGASTTISVTGTPDPYASYIFTASGGSLPTVTYTRNCAEPVIQVTSTCSYPITFTVTNTGGAMYAAQNVSVTQAGTPMPLSATTFQLAAGASTTISITGAHDPYVAYEFSATGGFVTTPPYTHTTCDAPDLTITTNACEADVSFTVTNNGGAMLTGQPFTVTRDGTNITTTIIPASPMQIAGGTSQTYTVPAGSDPYATYVFSTAGYAGTHSETHDCDDPVIQVTSDCSYPITFTVTNTGAAMPVPQNVSVTQAGTPMPLSATTITLVAGETTTISITGAHDPYAAYVFTASGGFVATTTYTHTTCDAPDLSITTNACGADISFTVTNNGSDMLTGQPFTVTRDGTNITTTITPASPMQIAGGTSQTYTVPAGSDPYATYVFSTAGYAGTHSETHDCDAPVIQVTSDCRTPITFTVTNTGGAMYTSQNVTVTQAGTPMPISATTIILGAGETTTISITGAHDPYAAYVFSATGGFVTTPPYTHTACDAPDLAITTNACGADISFTVTNNGGAMLTGQPFTVTQDGSNITSTVTPGSPLLLGAGGSQVYTIPAGSDPYATYVFSTAGYAGTHSETHDCDAPAIQVTSDCTYPITFTLTNNGGAMYAAQNVAVTQAGTPMPISATTVTLVAGGTTTISITGDHNPYVQYDITLSGGFAATTPYTHTACAAPDLSITTNACGLDISFTVTNNGGDMLTEQPFTVTQDGTDITATITPASPMQIAGGTSQTYTVPAGSDPYAVYIFSTAGYAGTHSQTHDCDDPGIQVTSDCSYPITFTITNTSGQMFLDQNVAVTQAGTPMPVSATTITLGAGGTTTVSITGDHDPYAQYDIVLTGGFLTMTSYTHTACAAPDLGITTNACGADISFTVSNNGGAMLTGQPFTVTQDGTDITSTVTPGSPLLLGAGEAQTYTLPADSDPYATYIFSTAGFAGTHSQTHDCEPQLSVMSDCRYPVTFTVTNSGGPMLESQAVTITHNGSPLPISAGSFELGANESTAISITGDHNPYLRYDFVAQGGSLPDISYTHQPCTQPALSLTTNQCGAVVEFTVTNTGGAMLAPQPFTVLREGTDITAEVTPASPFQLAAGESQTFRLPDSANPYAGYVFTTMGDASARLLMEHDCAGPELAITTQCTLPISFTLTNTGADMLVPHTFTITPNTGYTLEPAGHTFQLGAGETVTLALRGAALGVVYTFHTDDHDIAGDAMLDCPVINEPGAAAASVPAGGTSFGGLGLSGALNWGAVSVCPHMCPQWHVYHTDETGDWEIFRLDGVDEAAQKAITRNLSYGRGAGVDDMAPSRSPNGEWIVFTSNRDGNWEIYAAPSEGDESRVQRITYNTIALDTDPIWGPTNYVAFETTRDGNWELYMIDMASGQEYRLTDSPTSDINPFWSPDGSFIVFQSDRDGLWQIYELNLSTGAVTRLSDGSGNDVDPQYSSDGQQIVFRSYRDGAASVLYLMNRDGSAPRAISPLNADSTNAAWSPDNRLIAYQSDLDGDLDIYVYEVATGTTRQLTRSTIADYAPMWKCDSNTVVFTSEITGDPNIFQARALPLDAEPVDLLRDDSAGQLTFGPSNDIYPQGMPPEENASREGRLPLSGQIDVLGLQTDYLRPDTSFTPRDLSTNGIESGQAQPIQVCPVPKS